MAKAILTILMIVLVNVLVGCGGVDAGKSQLMPARTKTSLGSAAVVEVATAAEVDIVEQVAINRQAYLQGLEMLEEYYVKTGNNMKLNWVQKELSSLKVIPQYNYIIEASIAGPNLKATTSIPDADNLYKDAEEIAKRAGGLIIIRDAVMLRQALDKYNQLIKKHPSSDKIDDAAYQAGRIYESFKDYSIALLYFQRAYQWDPETPYPARFRAARVLDERLHRRAEGLELWRQALSAHKRDDMHKQWKVYAEKRIRKLTKSNEILE